MLRPDFAFGFPQQYIPGDEARGIDGYIAIPTGILTLPNPLPAVTWEEAQRRLGPSAHAVYIIGKLKTPVTVEQAGSEMQGIYARSLSTKPDFQRDKSLDFAPLRDWLEASDRPFWCSK